MNIKSIVSIAGLLCLSAVLFTQPASAQCTFVKAVCQNGDCSCWMRITTCGETMHGSGCVFTDAIAKPKKVSFLRRRRARPAVVSPIWVDEPKSACGKIPHPVGGFSAF